MTQSHWKRRGQHHQYRFLDRRAVIVPRFGSLFDDAATEHVRRVGTGGFGKACG